MSSLTLRLLGPPQVELNGAPLHIARRRTLALLLYLAVTDQRYQRDELTAFFWPELDPSHARADLRRALYQLHQTLGDGWIEANDNQVRFRRAGDCRLDVERFHELLTAAGVAQDASTLARLAEAVALYHSDFLAGFTLPDSPRFDEWQFFTGETYRNELATALEQLVHGHSAQGDWHTAITYARRWLALDPLREAVHRWLMQLYAWSDQQAAALRQYSQCQALLADELNIQPAPETEALYRAIQTRQFVAPALARQGSLPATTAPRTDDIRMVTAVSVGLTASGPPPPADMVDEGLPIEAVDSAALNKLAAAATELLTIAQRAAAPFGGAVEPVVAEDILILFGVDHVHEDDAERGLRTALAIGQAARRAGLAVQIGISSGLAYCRHQGMAADAILGPPVNLATRLRNRARAGEILVNRQVYLSTRGLLAYHPQQLLLPGWPRPVKAYRAAHWRAHPQKIRGIEGLPAPLIGRTTELALLRAALDRARQGRGQIVLLSGGAGVGKSRLVSELHQYAQAQQPSVDSRQSPVDHDQSLPPILWLEGRGVEFAETASYWLFADLLRGYFGDRENEGGTAPAQALIRRIEQLAPGAADELGPPLGQLLTVRLGNGWDERWRHSTPAQMHHQITRAVVSLVAALTRAQPVVLVFEDLHWVDTHSLDLIIALLDLLPTHRLLLLCVYRPGPTPVEQQLATIARRTVSAHCTTLSLSELNDEESRQLVAALLANEHVPAIGPTQLLAKAQGNPLFLEEIVRSLIDQSLLDGQGDGRQLEATLPPIAVPESLQSLILSRADKLAPPPHEVLQMASVLGPHFQPKVLGGMAENHADLDAILAQLTADAFIYPARLVPDAEYSFQHVLVRDAIYQDLPQARRRQLHQRAAQALEAHSGTDRAAVIEALAYHYVNSAVADKAVYYLLLAGQKALRAYANAEALGYFQQAQAYFERDAVRDHRQQLAVLDGIGQVYATWGDLQRGEPYLRQAIDLAQTLGLPVVEQVQRYFPLCHLLGWHNRADAVLALVDDGLRVLGADLSTPEAVMLITLKSDVYFNRGQHRSAMSLMAQVVEILPALAYSRQLLSAYNMIAMWSRYTKQVNQGFALLAAIEAKALAQGDQWLVGYLHGWPVLFLYEAIGDLAVAERSLQKVEAMAAQTGDELLKIQANTYRGAVHGWCEGHWAVATPYAEAAIRLAAQASVPRKSVFGYVTLGLAHYSRRAWADAVATLEIARATALDQRFRADCARRGDIGLAWSYLHLGRTAEAAALFHEVVAEEEVDIESLHLIACALAGLAAAVPDAARLQQQCDAIVAERGCHNALPLVQWGAQPAEPALPLADRALALPTTADELQQQGWQWHDPGGDSGYNFDHGLILHAANYCDLWLNNRRAPRLLRPVQGDCALQVCCRPAHADQLAMGGLLLWHDPANYLRLTWNSHGPGEINLLGCVGNCDLLLGRGALPTTEQIYLRLERVGTQVRGLYSADAVTWQSVGTVEFSVAEPLQIGLLAIGFIPRYVFPEASSEGTAIRFNAV
jgi:DNA-binding SARP family transcriptional activator